MVVAIDGPAGAGKSTVARAVADALGFTYLDTGAMYRCAALDPARDPATLDIGLGERVTLDGEDVSAKIRTPEVSARASEVAARPATRKAMVAKQRELMSTGNWVAEGRDVGTMVAPDAELKVFLTASPEERARRRADELGADYRLILDEQVIRDERDRSRAASPLIAADDSVEVDTTGRSIDEVVGEITALARERTAA